MCVFRGAFWTEIFPDLLKKLSDSKRCFIGSGKISRLKQVCLFGVFMLLFYICNKLTRYNHEQCGAASDGDGCPMTEELPAKNTLLYMSRT